MGCTLLARYLAAFPPARQDAPLPDAIHLSAVAEADARTGGTVRFNFGASNVLARQIVSGAPVDLFVSADEAQMDLVAAAGLLKEGTRVDLLRNQLAVAVPSDRPRSFKSIREIVEPA